MYWAILILCNIPVFFFIGYVLFNSKTGNPTSLVDTLIAILKVIFIPRLIREMLDMETDDAAGLIDIVAFLVLCVAVVYGEHYLIQNYF